VGTAARLGAGLLLLALLGVLLMPGSGFWLVFPPAIAAGSRITTR